MTGYRYTPDRAGEEELKFNFIGRGTLLQRLVDKIVKSGESGAYAHCILIGPRGIGKSHLLNLLYFSVKSDLSDSWVPIKFSEEEYYSIISLEDLLLKLLEYLNRETGDEDFLPGTQKRSHGSGPSQIDAAMDILLNWQKKTTKKILVMPENMQKLLPQLSEQERERLRGILSDKQPFLIIGSAVSVFDQILNHEEPFYNFFEPIRMEDLNSDEIEALILRREEYEKRDKIKNNIEEFRPKIRAVSRMTGGNPRLALFLYDLITEKEISSIEELFARILEEQTPYYQSVMESITPQQRKIVDMMAVAESPLTPTEIAAGSTITSNVVSGQIKRLEDLRIVRPVKLSRKRITRYEITDRLFRYWRKWRTPAGREKIEFFIEFLKAWYQPDELKDILDKMLDVCKKGDDQDDKPSHFRYALYCYEALSIEEKRAKFQKLFDASIEIEQIDIAEKELERMEREGIREDQSETIEIRKIRLLLKRKKYQEAHDKATEVINRGTANCEIYRINGSAYLGLDRYEDAIKYYDKAIELGDTNWLTWRNKAVAYFETKNYEQAVEYFEKSFEMGNEDWIDMSYSAEMLFMKGRYDKAIKRIDDAIALVKKENSKNAYLWRIKGKTLCRMGKYIDAVENTEKAIKLGDNDLMVWVYNGVSHERVHDYENALRSYDKSIEIDRNYHPAWEYRGRLLMSMKKPEVGLESLDIALSLEDECSNAWMLKGEALVQLNRYEEALVSIERAKELKPSDPEIWNQRGDVLALLRRYEDAVMSFDEAIKLDKDYVRAWRGRGHALSDLQNYDRAIESFDMAISLNANDVCSKINRARLLVLTGKDPELIDNIDAVCNELSKGAESCPAYKYVNMATTLSLSRKNAARRNYGDAEKYLAETMCISDTIEEDDETNQYLSYIRNLLQEGATNFAEKAMEMLIGHFGDEMRRVLNPFSQALKYIQTNDSGILEQLQQEERELVLEIVNKATQDQSQMK